VRDYEELCWQGARAHLRAIQIDGMCAPVRATNKRFDATAMMMEVYLKRLRKATEPDALRAHLRRNARGYAEAFVGVAAASLFIALVRQFTHIANISLIYLLVVLYLATRRGRAPAILASVLAFLAYDFFFIPPYYRFTVDDPSEWLSLFALLLTALVIGQLTSTVQARATEAIESRRRIATLYGFAQLIASTTDQQDLLDALVRRIVQVFGPEDLTACAIMLPDTLGNPSVRASAPEDHPALQAFDLQVREFAARASYVLRTGSPVADSILISAQGVTQRDTSLYLPLRSGKRIVGVLGIVGAASLRQLATVAPESADEPKGSPTPADGRPQDPQARLFLAFRDQIALALEHEALRQQAIHAEALRESDKLKDALLGTVTHDLRTPLASIKAAASSLLQPGVDWSDEDRRELLESIDESADRLNRLVSNLLNLSRLEAGVALPQKEWYALQDVLGAVLDRLDLSGQTHGRTIMLDLPDDLPLVPMDHEQIEQVLTNLIENALKYSPDDTPIEVRARVVSASRELEVRVIDHGIGIPASEARAIFDKFYRVQQVRLPWDPRHPPVGTGLGLAICASIVRAHGGRIWVESKPGEGATFIFTLPIPEERPAGSLPPVETLAESPSASPPVTPTPEPTPETVSEHG
jgi:two-component system sensor histidine kinase KdpD